MEQIFQSLREDERHIGEEYLSSLTDLNCNSKPLINMLTMLADENINYAHVIVRVVEFHISQVAPEYKLPILYLIDSIIKNVKSSYVQLFGQCIVNIFLNAFESVQHSQSQVLEKVRERMYALRQTWNDVFPPSKMYQLDVKVKRLDNNWPVTAKQPAKIHVSPPAIHVNPDFLKTGMVTMPGNTALPVMPNEMEEILQAKTRELLELKKRKLELELEQTNKHLEEQERQLNQATDAITVTPNAIPSSSSAVLRPPGLEPPLSSAALRAGGGGSSGGVGLFRHMRPGSAVATPNVPPLQQPFASQVPANKPKVHPVNAALLNSLRQRDPRLARQIQQQSSSSNTNDAQFDSKSGHKSSRSRSKSPTRSSSSRSGKNSNSSGSNSNSSSSRKRSDSKSSTASPSSGSDRRKGSSSSASSPSKRDKHAASSRSDKDSQERYSHNGSPTTTAAAAKHKSSPSSGGSTPKSKRSSSSSSNSQKSRSGKTSSSSTRSRSRSPCKDVDMRSVSESERKKQDEHVAISSSTTAATETNDLEKHELNILKPGHNYTAPATAPALSMDIDLRTIHDTAMPAPPPPPAFPKSALITAVPTATAAAHSNKNSTTTATATESSVPRSDISSTTAATTSSTKLPTKVSFKIQKPFNKFEKSTAHLSTAMLLASSSATTTTSSSSTDAAGAAATTTTCDNGKEPLMSSSSSSSGNVCDVSSKLKQQQLGKLVNNTFGGEKRTAAVIAADQMEEDQPQMKRSKSAKLDALFGSEDVDLRRELPVGPTPVIVVEDDSMENWDSDKSPRTQHSPNTSTLDELRIKLAKSVRNNKMTKSDKFSKDPTQRLKQIAELKLNEDSQEAHDEQMRTILTQAQEMYENQSMNQEQYKDLVQKVVAINESNKLKEANRREAAAALAHDENPHLQRDRERSAARDAVMRKRIPKLKNNDNQRNTSSPRSDGSPIYDEQQQQHQHKSSMEDSQSKLSAMQKGGKGKRHNDGKRRKPSKWGEQVDPVTAQRAAWLANNSQLTAAGGNMNNKRGGNAGGGGGFRGNSGSNNMQQGNMRLPVTGPWQQPFSGVPSMLVAAPAPTNVASLPPLVVMPPSDVPPPPQQPPAMLTLPTKAINSLDNPMVDVVRSITIDGGTKEIRFYNQVAVIFMDGDEPHEIGFQMGQRAICIDNCEPLQLHFNDDYKPFTLDGQVHRIRFGFPSRELYIDEHWYEIYFGGPAVSLPIGNKLHVLKAEGPPPNVDIGRVRHDLVVGKINMVVDAHTIVPLFLDAKLQTFQLGAEQHQLQFVDSFLYALLDGQLQRIEYGGLPKSITLNGGRNCFIRFGTLPKGVQAGKTHVQDMVYIKTDAPVDPPQPPMKPIMELIPNVPLPTNVAAAALSNLNIDELFQKLVSSGIINSGSVPAGPAAPTPTPAIAPVTVSQSEATPAAGAASAVTSAEATKAPAVEPAALPTEPIKRIDLSKPDTIKTRQSAIVAALYLGMQCSSCGVRFPPEQTIKYSQHLDWHFRQNRRERDSTRKVTSRKWFYDLNDWKQYEEIEDIEEREKNFMEAHQLLPDAADEVSNQRSMDSPVPSCAAGSDDVDRSCAMCHEKFEQFYNEELEEWHLRSAISVDDKIYHPLCYEDYKASLNPPPTKTNEETDTKTADVDMMNSTDDNAMDTVIKIEINENEEPGEVVRMDDDDDDVIVLPNEEPSVTEIVDDDDEDNEYVPSNSSTTTTNVVVPQQVQVDNNTEEQQQQQQQEEQSSKELKQQTSHNESANESDVEIQEPHIPFTDLDTYVEKEVQPTDEAAPGAFLNVKIKEEPKDDDEDEDDGFEDVGTVVVQPPPEDEISINSSETQTQTIASSASPVTLDRPPSVISLTMQPGEDDFVVQDASVLELNTSIDGNGDTTLDTTHNLSAAGPAPALPLANLVNKIKINITKSSSSNSHNNSPSNNNFNPSNAMTTTSTTVGSTPPQQPPPAATAASSTSSSSSSSAASAISVIGGGNSTNNNNLNNNNEQLGEVNAIQTISTIPVLCGGNTFVPKIATSSSANSNAAGPTNISSISVIGSSYGNTSTRFTKTSPIVSTATATATSSSAATATITNTITGAAIKAKTPPPTPAAAAAVEPEPEPVIELKPALRNVSLTKTKKVQSGVETSGLCAIM